ncbi:hypothetical protein [Nonomuraea turkmeniaca]|nr:hypothetical protein [Nonomuraea turkmeniaca]
MFDLLVNLAVTFYTTPAYVIGAALLTAATIAATALVLHRESR